MPHDTANRPIVTAPEKYRNLPCMAKLTENQQNFVWAMVETGGKDPGRAAAMAGFGGTDGARRVALHRLMHDEDVIDAVNKIAASRMKFSGLLAAEALIDVVLDAGHKDRVKAIGMLLDQSGHAPVKLQRIEVIKPEPSIEATVARIRNLASMMNIDPRPLLLQAGVDPTIIDAEFQEVHDEGSSGDHREGDQATGGQVTAAAPLRSGLHDGPGHVPAGHREDPTAVEVAPGGEGPSDGGGELKDDEEDWSAL
jgi:hypothetical protein